MILNPFPCEKCGEELQLENIALNVDSSGNITRMCTFCGHTEVIKE